MCLATADGSRRARRWVPSAGADPASPPVPRAGPSEQRGAGRRRGQLQTSSEAMPLIAAMEGVAHAASRSKTSARPVTKRAKSAASPTRRARRCRRRPRRPALSGDDDRPSARSDSTRSSASMQQATVSEPIALEPLGRSRVRTAAAVARRAGTQPRQTIVSPPLTDRV
jgi:hypothetical protein